MHKWKLFKRNSVILLMIAAIICTSLFLLLPVRAYASNVITFPDSQLEAVIRAQINKPTGDILDTDVSAITSLPASGKGISSLEGIQHLKSLKAALLTYNQIRDISPLSTLTGLTVLSLGNNKVENIEAVRNLTNLKSLTLDNNSPVSLEPITGLTQLKMLSLNNIGTFDPGIVNRLSSTLSLLSLSIEGNGITDIAFLTPCVNLTSLSLGNNKISNLSQVSKFSKLKGIGLNNNPLSDISPISSLTGLTSLNIESTQISSIIPLKSLSYLSSLNISGTSININELSGFSSLTDLHMNNSNVKDISSLAGLRRLYDLSLDNNQISDLGPLSGLTTLRYLSLVNNQISNLSPLASLSNLTSLTVNNNRITDIRPLSSLTQLGSLYINDNQITDINILTSLPGLASVGVGGNPLSSIQPVIGLSNLTSLELDNLGISDISFLLNMPQLMSLSLGSNPITDFNPIKSLPNLQIIGLSDTGIKDLTILSNVYTLVAIDSKNNGITDIRPLKGLKNLLCLYLSGNRITDYRPIEDIYDQLMYKDFEFEILPVAAYLETPVDGSTVGGTITLSGYFLDPENVSKIEVLLDGVKIGDATYGDLRQDIANLYPKYYNSNSGFNYLLNTANLTAGNHTITIRETSAYGTLYTLPPKVITVSRLIPRGYLDKPSSGETVTGNYNIYGWFLDPSKVSKIEVLIDGAVVGNAVYGDLRNDVYNAYPAYGNYNSGFHYTLNTTSLNEGAHTIFIKETGNNGVKTTLSSKAFYIARLLPRGNIDRPTNGQTIKGIFKVSGWFLDTSGVDKIEVLVDGVVKGTAVYGLSRPDVASSYPQYNNSLSGYGFSLDTSTLTVGKHTISVREKGKNGATTSLPAKTVYITR